MDWAGCSLRSSFRHPWLSWHRLSPDIFENSSDRYSSPLTVAVFSGNLVLYPNVDVITSLVTSALYKYMNRVLLLCFIASSTSGHKLQLPLSRRCFRLLRNFRLLRGLIPGGRNSTLSALGFSFAALGGNAHAVNPRSSFSEHALFLELYSGLQKLDQSIPRNLGSRTLPLPCCGIRLKYLFRI